MVIGEGCAGRIMDRVLQKRLVAPCSSPGRNKPGDWQNALFVETRPIGFKQPISRRMVV